MMRAFRAYARPITPKVARLMRAEGGKTARRAVNQVYHRSSGMLTMI